MLPRSRRKAQLLGAGYLTLDLVVRDLNTRDYWQSIGGTCGNVSTFASALGANVTVLARVGRDRRGDLLLSSLEAMGIDVAHIERSARLNSPGVVQLARTDIGRTHRFAFRCPVCEASLPKTSVVSKQQAENEAKRIDEFDAFFFDRATLATVSLAEAARNVGLLVIFEPTTVPRTALANQAAALSDIVKVSQQPNNGMDAWRPTQGASTRFIVETLGSRGVRFRSRFQNRWCTWREMPCVAQSNIRDTAGAGDWLTAGMITCLLSVPSSLTSDDMHSSIEYGQRLSSLSLSFDGAQGALTTLGAQAIRLFANSTLPIEFPPEVATHPLLPRPKTPQAHGYCELCLTEVASSR